MAAANTSGPDQSQNIVSNADDIGEKLAGADIKFTALSSDAKDATDAEHAMTLRESIRKYPKAIGWSVLLSLAVAMEGYGGYSSPGIIFQVPARLIPSLCKQTSSSSPPSSPSHPSIGNLASSTNPENTKSPHRGRVVFRTEHESARSSVFSSMASSRRDMGIVLR